MGARWRHPWRQRSCLPTPTRPAEASHRRTARALGFQVGRGVRSVFLRKTDLTPEALQLWLRSLLFFLQSGVDAQGNCPWPGGWAAQGRKRHGWRARAYRDVFTESPAQPTLPANPQQPRASSDHPEGLRRWLDNQILRKQKRPSAGPGRIRGSGQAGIRIPASLRRPVRWPSGGRQRCDGPAAR